MGKVAGSLKSSKLVLQGQGTVGSNVDMKVVNDEFTMSMGDEVLMTVGHEDDSDDDDHGGNKSIYYALHGLH